MSGQTSVGTGSADPTETETTDTDDSDSAKEEASEQFEDWLSGLSFRVLVYASILTFSLLHVMTFSQLHGLGVLDAEGTQSLKFVLGLLNLLVILTFVSDMSRGVVSGLVRKSGKHRGYAVAGVVVGLLVFSPWDPLFAGSLPSELQSAYRTVSIVAVAAVVWVFVEEGALYEGDIDRLQTRLKQVVSS